MERDTFRQRLRHLWQSEVGLIGTGAAIAIAAGAAAAQGIHGTRTASKQNKEAIRASEASDLRASALESRRVEEERRALDVQLAEQRREREEQLKYDREEAARKERQYNEAAARDQARWQDYLRINEPMWRQGAGVLGSLYDIAGAGPAPAFSMPTQPPPAPMGGAPASSGGSSAPSSLMTLGQRPGVSSTMPVRAGGRTFPTMPTPNSGGQSLQDFMSLAQLASRMPKAAYTGDVNLSSQAMG